MTVYDEYRYMIVYDKYRYMGANLLLHVYFSEALLFLYIKIGVC